MKEKPSLLATPLLVLVLILTIWHAIRLWTGVAWYDLLQEFAPSPGPLYTALSGAVWMLTGLILMWNIWQKKARAAIMLFGAATSHTVWYWTDRLILQSPRANWPFILLVNVVLLAYVLAITIPNLSSNDIMERGV